MTAQAEAAAAVEWFSSHVIAAIGEPKRILLIGSGVLSDPFRTAGHEVLGVGDIPAWIDTGSSTEPVAVPRPDLAAICEMPAEEGDLPALLDRLASSLAPGSLLFILSRNPSSLRPRLSALRGDLQEVSALCHAVSLERLLDVLESAGFVVTGITRLQEAGISQDELDLLPPTVRVQLSSVDDATTSHFALRARMVTPDASGDIRGAIPLDLEADHAALEMPLRLERYERGTQLLRQLLFAEGEARQKDLAERDARIVALLAELFAKVGERDVIIRELQQELHQKVGERDQIILDLQQLLGENVSNHALQAELFAKVGERDVIIRELQQELHQKVGERDQVILGLKQPIDQNDGDIAELRVALSLAEAAVRESSGREEQLAAELDSIHPPRFWKAMSLYWRARAALDRKPGQQPGRRN